MLIDFSEIKSGHDFEKFAELFLRHLGYKILRGAAIGSDGGVDIICEESLAYSQGSYRWLVSCKHRSRTIGQNDDCANINKLFEHKCNGFMFVYSSNVTESLRQSVEKVSSNRYAYKFYEPREIEQIIISLPRMMPLMNQFFPSSHSRFIKMDQDCHCQMNGHQDGLYIVYVQDKTQKMVAHVFCDTCCDQYTYHLNESKIEYGVLTLKKRAY